MDLDAIPPGPVTVENPSTLFGQWLRVAQGQALQALLSSPDNPIRRAAQSPNMQIGQSILVQASTVPHATIIPPARSASPFPGPGSAYEQLSPK